jgi:flagellar hook-associated protein 2
MAGSISSVGVGSGLELGSILEQLREIDQEAVTRQADKITTYESQINEFTEVNNQLLALKHEALDLSLESTYLGRSITSSDDKVFTATVLDGNPVQTNTVTVDRIASKSSWLSTGLTDGDTSVYVPTSQESTTGVADSATDVVVTTDGTLDLSFGDTPTDISIAVTAGMTMDALITAINSGSGGLVTASPFSSSGETFLRIETATPGGTGEANRVAVTTNDTDLVLASPSQTLVYTLGDSDPISVEVAADTTLSQLVDLINDDENNPGVTASVIDDGSESDPFKLVLQSNEVGLEQEISFLSQLPDITMALSPDGKSGEDLNAQVTIDGIAYQRQTNSISDIVTGVTFSLQSVGEASFSVVNNNENVKEMVTAMVTAYNDVVAEVRSKSSYDEDTGEFGLLFGTTLRDLPYSLQALMTTTYEGDPEKVTRSYDSATASVIVEDKNIHSMFNLGLAFERDGSITLDEEVLSAALAGNGENVQAFFLGDEEAGVEGFADKVNLSMREFTGYTGMVASEKTAAQQRIDDLSQSIEDQTLRLDKKYDLLAQRFVALDQYMSEMTSISNFLVGQFDSLSNGWGQVGGKN